VDGSDKSAVGYLGTTQTFTIFRAKLTAFSLLTQWPRFNESLDSPLRPRLPGAYKLITDALAHATTNAASKFTPNSWSSRALTDLVAQWKVCTTTGVNCPQAGFYNDVNQFFRENYSKYSKLTGCETGFPSPTSLDGDVGQLSLLQYLYGWVPFNAYCTKKYGANVNALNPFAPNPWPPFSKAIDEYIQLQYNFSSHPLQQSLQFNPFTQLVHGEAYLNANSYAFSVDDAAGFQSNSGEGLVVAVGGPHGLPNNNPVPKPADFNTDFEVNLGDTKAQNRPEWVRYGVCKLQPDTDFPPFPPGQTNYSRTIVVPIATKGVPCMVTIQDKAGQLYRIQVNKKVPWAAWNKGSFDASVVSCTVGGTRSWCQNLNELSLPDDPRFALVTPPSCANPNCNPF